jgi:hypothetical protein
MDLKVTNRREAPEVSEVNGHGKPGLVHSSSLCRKPRWRRLSLWLDRADLLALEEWEKVMEMATGRGYR